MHPRKANEMKHQKSIRLPKPAVDYRGFRLKRINEPRFRHLWYLLFWPIYWLRYPLIEAINPPERCAVVGCIVDEWIPFNEWFLIPYMLWMVCMLAMVAYTLFYDVESFKKYSRFLILTFSATTVIYLLWPTCQNLRPETFPRDNLMSRLVGLLYAADTSTNVCPSEHVIGSLAVVAAAFHCPYFRKPLRLTLVTVLMVTVALSTVFLKQHSILDVFAAIPLCIIVHFICFPIGKRKGKPADFKERGLSM